MVLTDILPITHVICYKYHIFVDFQGTVCDTTTPETTTVMTSQHTTPCATFTTGGNSNRAMCVFPFLYQGKSYFECITENNGDTLWCATSSNYDRDFRWGNCAG